MDLREPYLPKKFRPEGSEESALYSFYLRCLPIIKKVAVNYVNLDVASGMEDFINQGFFGVRETFFLYKNNSSSLKWTSFLVWQLQKCNAELCPQKDKMVVISDKEGDTEVLSYQKFQKVKRTLPSDAIYTVISRLSSLEDLARTNRIWE